MRNQRPHDQGDLFGTAGGVAQAGFEPPPSEFILRIRDELLATLARVREANSLPWRDLTAATLAELRFNSIAGWLPDQEAAALRAEFQREMRRLYDLAATGGAA